MDENKTNIAKAVIAGGCFWCLEHSMRELDGVVDVKCGYTAGHTENPSYRQVTTGTTGHAEALEVSYDPSKLSYADILQKFFTSHNPTQLNRQGVDIGTQYRSAIFYATEDERDIAQKIIRELDASGTFKTPIVTAVEPISPFWLAEEYHQQYYDKYEKETGQTHIRLQLKRKGKLK